MSRPPFWSNFLSGAFQGLGFSLAVVIGIAVGIGLRVLFTGNP